MNTVQAKDFFIDFTLKLSACYDADEAKAITQLVCSELLLIKPHQLPLLNKTLSADELQTFTNMLNQLLTGEPIQYVLGYAWFFGLKLKVNSSVLIPRPETEELVELILNRYKNSQTELPIFIDIGTGSGCIPIAIKKHLPQATVIGIDVMEAALEVARLNASQHHTDITFCKLDALDQALLNTFIAEQTEKHQKLVLISNPPYVKQSESTLMHRNVVEFEPATALFVPDDNALIFYEAMAALIPVFGTHIDSIWLEINPLLADETAALFQGPQHLKNVGILLDMQGKKRFVSVG